MSYSKVKDHGFPDLGIIQPAYHIVREADLLAAYDFDRSLIYKMHKHNLSLEQAYQDAVTLFDNRVSQHVNHNLLLSSYSKSLHNPLLSAANQRIATWRTLIRTPML